MITIVCSINLTVEYCLIRGDSTNLTNCINQTMVCCKCSVSGICSGCKCVKSNKNCINCLPMKNNRCRNSTQPLMRSIKEDSEQRREPSVYQHSPLAQASDVRDLNHHLGSPPECQPPNFVWGKDLPGVEFCQRIDRAYNEVISWRRNVFLLPFGKVSKEFVQSVTDWLQAFAQNSTKECIALKACLVMQTLLLQKPSAKSKAKDHVNHLRRRLELWNEGDIEALIKEGRCIQARLPKSANASDEAVISRVFSRLMFTGNVRGALNYLSRKSTGAPMKLDDVVATKEGIEHSVEEILKSLHPEDKPIDQRAVIECTPHNALPFDPIVFSAINGSMIKDIANHSTGSAGPSGIDVTAWRKMCSSFKEVSANLCDAIAAVARRLCTIIMYDYVLVCF